MDSLERSLIAPLTRTEGLIGQSVPRSNAPRAVAGRGRYTDDLALPRMLHAAFLRSPHAHARIVKIDTSIASTMPGVVRVATGAELADRCKPMVGLLSCFVGMKAAPQPAMAVDRACWHGEPVAIVVANTRAQAEDAVERIEVEWEPLPVAIDKTTALEPGSPLVHTALGDNLMFEKTIGSGNVDEAFAKADIVLEESFHFGRHTAVSLEPRAIIADYEPASAMLTLTTSSQVPHMIQTVFSKLLGIPEHRLRVVAPDVGGSFGMKIHTYGDELATAIVGMELARPVKFVADRMESFVSDIHARENLVKARIAVRKDGTLEAMEIDDISGVGAYSQYPRTSAFEANQILNITGGPYDHKHYRARARVVYLNKVPTSQYRAVGHPIGIAVGEAMMDMAAAATGLDPVEIRRRNVMRDNSYPRVTASGVRVRELSHQACLEKLVERMNYTALRAEQTELRKKGIYRGIGIATFIKGTAPGPDGYYGIGGAPIASQDGTMVKLEPSGAIICAVGVSEQGQGVTTVMAQIAADAIGVPLDQIRVIAGDTEATPYGGGTYASRATAIGGEATWQAGRALRKEILRIAGALLKVDVDLLDIVAGNVVDLGTTNVRVTLAEIGRIAHFQVGELPPEIQPEVMITRHYRMVGDLYIFTNGVHGSYVEVDTDTGFIKLLRHWIVEDCGRIINPNLADEQVRGGCVQGIGGGLYEHCIYDANGQLQNGTMADYLTPMAGEMPDIDVAHVQTPTTVTQLGAKGAGESGTGAAPGAVMCAVNDALRPFNARVTEQPMTPRVVLRALGRI